MCTELQLRQITGEVSQHMQRVLQNKLYKVILYGSYARGDYANGSDIDIMVLADINGEEKPRLQKAVDRVSSDMSIENDITVSISLRDRKFFEAHAGVLPFYRNVIAEGVELYGTH